MSENTSTPGELEVKSVPTVATTVAFVIVLVLVCVGSIAATGFGVYRVAMTSPVVLRVGGLALSIEVTDNPECTSLIIGCLINPPVYGPKYLTVWSAITTYNSSGQHIAAHRILKLPVP